LREFQYRVVRRRFAPKKEELSGGWRELHYEDVHISHEIFTSRTINFRRMGWTWPTVLIADVRNVYSVFVGKSERRTLERP
jgi:hypothetical protein